MSEQSQQVTTERQQATTQTGAGEEVISYWQSITYLSSTILGVTVLTLPRSIATMTQNDPFSPVITAGVITMIIVWMLTRVGQWFPGLTLVGYLQKMFTFRSNKRMGRWLAFPFLIVLISWWLCGVAVALRVFGEVQRSAVFSDTPPWFIVASMLFTGALISHSRAEVIARLNELLFPLIVIPLLIIGLSSLEEVEWINFLPLFQFDWRQFILGTLYAMFAFQGVSVITVAMASYQQPEKATQSHTIAIGLVTILYVLITVSSIGVFGHEEVQRLMWPTLELVKSAPGILFERIEAGFLSIWVVAVFLTVANLLTAAVSLASEYFAIKKKYQVWLIVFYYIVIFSLAMWPDNVQQSIELAHWFGLAGVVLAFVITPTLFLMAKLRGMDDASKES